MKITHFVKIIFLSLFFAANQGHAWSGYDYDEKSQIDIGPGNLVREGLVIQFYNSKSDSYHSAKILVMEENSGNSTILKVEDLDDGQEKVFLMDAQN